MVLSERYATLASILAVTVAFQPLIPSLAPLACLGLSLRYWLERKAFLRGRLDRQPMLPFRTTRRMVRAAMTCIWLGIVCGSALSVWVLGEPVVAGVAADSQDSFLSRCFTITAAPAFAAFLLSLIIPAVMCLSLGCHTHCFVSRARTPGRKSGDMNYQEAWLIMTHNGQLATYQLRDQAGGATPGTPGGASLLDSLQSYDDTGIDRKTPVAGAPSYLSREGDVTPSLAVIGDKAPSRGKVGYVAPKSKPQAKAANVEPEGWQPTLDIFNQLRTAAAVAPKARTPERMQGRDAGSSGDMV